MCAIAGHQLRLALARPGSTLTVIAVPLNFLILFVLFALSGGRAPISVYQERPSPQSHALVASMAQNPSFIVSRSGSPGASARAMDGSDSVASVTVPPLVESPAGHRDAVVNATVDNLNSDFADDIRRGLPMAVLQYYQAHDPRALPVTVRQRDTYPSTVSFLDYIAVSVEVVALMLGGLIQGGIAMSGEWDAGTMKEIMLPAVPAWAVVSGKALGAAVGTIASGACVLAILTALGVRPQAWGELAAVTVALTVVFVAIGLAIGSTLRSNRAIIPMAIALGLPLFFISGAFGPISWTTSGESAIAHVFPVLYANSVVQDATYGFKPLNSSWAVIAGMLAVWAFVGIGLSILTHRRAAARQ